MGERVIRCLSRLPKSGGLGRDTEEDPGPRPWIKRPRVQIFLIRT